MKKRAVLILAVMLIVFAVGMCACRKKDNGGAAEHEWWLRGHFLTGLSQPMLVTMPEYVDIYPNETPIALTPMEGVDLSQYVDGDVIEIRVESIQELSPCLADVLDVRFIEHGDVSDIDSDVMDMLAERGWIELKTETIID